ncbi:UbiA family prenyltransferase [Sedimentitalea sp. XS_ASV28]|uniref:UbiA family prenyltransferase n=1 Tax=Sedimentitalea sp. XS_ASV28 TaxID=3241296 RepID=UPI0035158EAF
MKNGRWLIVDLDGTLLRSDMLLESFWNVLSHDARVATGAAFRLATGQSRAAEKDVLAQHAQIDIARLPYNADVLELVAQRREAGDRVALVTASNIRFAQAIADHLGCFDEVHGSDESHNLKSSRKAAFLIERFGEGNFDYAGDSFADLPVWAVSGEAVTVGAPPALREQAGQAAGQAQHLDRPAPVSESRLPPWLRAVRPHQWLKNVLVFLPVLTAHVGDPMIWLMSVLAFVTMSMVASSVYLFNDLLDLSSDRAHARKYRRPLASGDMDLWHATILAPVLFFGGLLISVLLMPVVYTAVLLGYFLLTMAYSLFLKRKLIVDICLLAGLYTIRVVAGAAATGIALSPWLLALSAFLFLSLAAVKRQAELVSDDALGREGASGRAYLTSDMPILSGMALTAGYNAVLVVALYISSPAVSALYKSPYLLWGICPILLYWISRTVMITHRGYMDDDPVIFAIKDGISRWCGLAIILIGVASALW